MKRMTTRALAILLVALMLMQSVVIGVFAEDEVKYDELIAQKYASLGNINAYVQDPEDIKGAYEAALALITNFVESGKTAEAKLEYDAYVEAIADYVLLKDQALDYINEQFDILTSAKTVTGASSYLNGYSYTIKGSEAVSLAKAAALAGVDAVALTNDWAENQTKVTEAQNAGLKAVLDVCAEAVKKPVESETVVPAYVVIAGEAVYPTLLADAQAYTAEELYKIALMCFNYYEQYGSADATLGLFNNDIAKAHADIAEINDADGVAYYTVEAAEERFNVTAAQYTYKYNAVFEVKWSIASEIVTGAINNCVKVSEFNKLLKDAATYMLNVYSAKYSAMVTTKLTQKDIKVFVLLKDVTVGTGNDAVTYKKGAAFITLPEGVAEANATTVTVPGLGALIGYADKVPNHNTATPDADNTKNTITPNVTAWAQYLKTMSSQIAIDILDQKAEYTDAAWADVVACYNAIEQLVTNYTLTDKEKTAYVAILNAMANTTADAEDANDIVYPTDGQDNIPTTAPTQDTNEVIDLPTITTATTVNKGASNIIAPIAVGTVGYRDFTFAIKAGVTLKTVTVDGTDYAVLATETAYNDLVNGGKVTVRLAWNYTDNKTHTIKFTATNGKVDTYTVAPAALDNKLNYGLPMFLMTIGNYKSNTETKDTCAAAIQIAYNTIVRIEALEYAAWKADLETVYAIDDAGSKVIKDKTYAELAALLVPDSGFEADVAIAYAVSAAINATDSGIVADGIVIDTVNNKQTIDLDKLAALCAKTGAMNLAVNEYIKLFLLLSDREASLANAKADYDIITFFEFTDKNDINYTKKAAKAYAGYKLASIAKDAEFTYVDAYNWEGGKEALDTAYAAFTNDIANAKTRACEAKIWNNSTRMAAFYDFSEYNYEAGTNGKKIAAAYIIADRMVKEEIAAKEALGYSFDAALADQMVKVPVVDEQKTAEANDGTTYYKYEIVNGEKVLLYMNEVKTVKINNVTYTYKINSNPLYTLLYGSEDDVQVAADKIIIVGEDDTYAKAFDLNDGKDYDEFNFYDEIGIYANLDAIRANTTRLELETLAFEIIFRIKQLVLAENFYDKIDEIEARTDDTAFTEEEMEAYIEEMTACINNEMYTDLAVEDVATGLSKPIKVLTDIWDILWLLDKEPTSPSYGQQKPVVQFNEDGSIKLKEHSVYLGGYDLGNDDPTYLLIAPYCVESDLSNKLVNGDTENARHEKIDLNLSAYENAVNNAIVNKASKKTIAELKAELIAELNEYIATGYNDFVCGELGLSSLDDYLEMNRGKIIDTIKALIAEIEDIKAQTVDEFEEELVTVIYNKISIIWGVPTYEAEAMALGIKIEVEVDDDGVETLVITNVATGSALTTITGEAEIGELVRSLQRFFSDYVFEEILVRSPEFAELVDKINATEYTYIEDSVETETFGTDLTYTVVTMEFDPAYCEYRDVYAVAVITDAEGNQLIVNGMAYYDDVTHTVTTEFVQQSSGTITPVTEKIYFYSVFDNSYVGVVTVNGLGLVK